MGVSTWRGLPDVETAVLVDPNVCTLNVAKHNYLAYLKLQGPLPALLLLLPVASAASPCTSDIEAAGIRVGDAAANIAEAVSACKNNASACALDISSAVTNLGMASESITKAVSDCGGTNNTECAKDITEIATALGKAATSVSTAATDCKKLDFKV